MNLRLVPCASRIALAAFCVLLPVTGFATKPENRVGKPETRTAKPKPEVNVVEMFAGIKSGDIEVSFIPRDATEATVLVKNKTDKPVAVQLPEAFAGVPVLAQIGGRGGPAGGGMLGFGPGGVGPGGPGGAAGGAGAQGVGGGFPGGGFPGGGMPGGGFPGGGLPGGGFPGGGFPGGRFPGGFMNVGPDKVVKVKVPLVCLEFGKKDPNPRLKYELRPLESFSQNPGVAQLCSMLGKGEVSQNTAQAAAWNLTNGLTFEQLAKKNRSEHLNGTVERFFSAKELDAAKRVIDEVGKRNQAASQQASAKKSTSVGNP